MISFHSLYYMRESSKCHACIGCHRGVIFSNRHMLLDYHYLAFLHFLHQPLKRFLALKALFSSRLGSLLLSFLQGNWDHLASSRAWSPLSNDQVVPNSSSFSKPDRYFKVSGIFSPKHFDCVMVTATFSSEFVFPCFI